MKHEGKIRASSVLLNLVIQPGNPFACLVRMIFLEKMHPFADVHDFEVVQVFKALLGRVRG